MILIPFLQGLTAIARAPITWALVFLNVSIYLINTQNFDSKKSVDDIVTKRDFIAAQGEFFTQFIMAHHDTYPPYLVELAQTASAGKTESLLILGKMALRDRRFIEEGRDSEYSGDQVSVGYWREKFGQVLEYQSIDPSYSLGLSRRHFGFLNWFSYQFIHGSWMHLLGNMWFLIIFGCFLEPILGTLGFFLIYITSGVFAALAYFYLSGLSAVPLVGASGAISGLMGVFTVMNWKKPVRFLYWLVPMRTYSGFVFLPTWVALIYWSASDIAGYLSSIPEVGGVAHAAHLGGIAIGGAIGATMVFAQKWANTFSVETAVRS